VRRQVVTFFLFHARMWLQFQAPVILEPKQWRLESLETKLSFWAVDSLEHKTPFMMIEVAITLRIVISKALLISSLAMQGHSMR